MWLPGCFTESDSEINVKNTGWCVIAKDIIFSKVRVC